MTNQVMNHGVVHLRAHRQYCLSGTCAHISTDTRTHTLASIKRLKTEEPLRVEKELKKKKDNKVDKNNEISFRNASAKLTCTVIFSYMYMTTNMPVYQNPSSIFVYE